jgi:hypothetical protein
VGGTEVGGTDVARTGVGGTEVAVTTTGVGGMDVLVGSAATAMVAVGTAGTWVVTGGGLPAAGNLQAVIISASITSATHVKMIFLFMVASLAPNANISMVIFYIILPFALYCFNKNWVAINKPKLGVIHPDGGNTLQRAVMLTDSAADT